MRLGTAGVLLTLALLAVLLTPPAAPGVRLVAAEGLQRLSPAVTCPVRGDFEGQFTSSSEMPIFLECVLGGIEAWIDVSYHGMPHPQAYYFVPSGYEGADGCRFTAQTMAYCLGPRVVYLGEDAIW